MNKTDFLLDSFILDDGEDANYVVISLYVPIAMLGLVCNILVIFVVFKFHFMRSVTNYFLVNLTVADLLVTIVCMPNAALLAYTPLWLFNDITCKLVNYLQCISVASSVFTITVMALDRYLAITRPLGFGRWFTKRSTIIIIIGIWLTSMIIFSPLLIVTEVHVIPILNTTIQFCSENWTHLDGYVPKHVFGGVSFSIMFAIPGMLILWAYTLMGKKLCLVRPPFDENSVSTQQSYRLVRERKRVAWILLMLVLIFACCWLPYNLMQLLLDYNCISGGNIATMKQYMLLLGHTNSALNPIIYCAMSRNFRKSLKQILSRSQVNFNGRRNHHLQVKMIEASPSPQLQVQMTRSKLQTSQKTTKTCAV